MIGQLLATLLLLPAQQNGNSGGYCEETYDSSDTLMWVVDHDSVPIVNSMIGVAGYLSTSDFSVAIDQVLQNTPRHTRARMRHRVRNTAAYEACDPYDGFTNAPCIATTTDFENNLCADTPSSLAWAGCSGPFNGDNCSVAICSTGRALNWGSGRFQSVMSHELGHAFGLAHVDATNQPPTVANCGTSDGCEGELMCQNIGSVESQVPRAGDATGIRLQMHGTAAKLNRQVAFGRRTPWGGRTECSSRPRQPLRRLSSKD